MGLFREVLYGALKHADNAASEWVTTESAETEGHKTEIVKFRAKKIHNRASTVYETTVEIKDNTYISVKDRRKKYNFSKSDIAGIELKMTFLFSIFYTVLCVMVGILLLVGGLGSISDGTGASPTLFLLAVFCFAVPFYTALIRTINIKLKNGSTVKIYYNLKGDPDVLISKLRK